MEEYKEDEFIRRFIQKSAAIAFVPPSFVRVFCSCLLFVSHETWMNGQFRPRMWNYYAHSGHSGIRHFGIRHSGTFPLRALSEMKPRRLQL